MRIINVTPEMTVLPLGRLGENESTKFIFDVSDWLEQYPDATIGLANKLPHASASYPCTLEDEEDGKVSWTITSAELSVEGKGKCQLQAVEGTTVEKKKIYTTDIGEALDPDADPPEEWESYVTAVTALKGDAEDAAEDAEAYAVGKRGGVDVDSDDPAYHNNAKYYAETVDPSIKADKVSGATSGNFAGLDENGNLTDSGHKHSDYLTSHQDITGKADKVSSPTSGNFAGLDSNGNLTDSGKKASDFLTSHQDITGKADKVSGGTENNFAALDSNGNLKDSGKKASDFLTGDVVSGKADKVSGGTENNFAALDSSGNLKDSGHKHSDYLTAHQDITGKADKVSSPTSGNFAGLDENGNLTDSGHKHSDYLTSHQDISGKSNLTNLAPAFSASSTYEVGDHVTYDGKYYVCSTAISTAAAWDSSKWTEKTVGAEAQSVLIEINNRLLSDDVKTALMLLAEKAAYSDNQGQSVYNALAGALYSAWPVTNTLTHCTSSNSSQSVTKNGSYSATITADEGYTLTGATVLITMGGVDVTSTAYSNGTISIASVTGVLSISITAAAVSQGYVTDGLVAYWDGIDNTGSAHDGNATTWVDKVNQYTLEAGTFGSFDYMTWGQNYLEFAGDYRQGLHLDSFWNLSQYATIEVVFASDSTGTQMIATFDREATGSSPYDARRVDLFSDNTVGGIGKNENSYTNTESAITAIRKIAILYNSFSVTKLLINNTETSKSNKTHSFSFSGNPQIRIGRENETLNQGSAYPFDGKIYAMRVYNRQLTSEELALNYSYDMERFGLE